MKRVQDYLGRSGNGGRVSRSVLGSLGKVVECLENTGVPFMTFFCVELVGLQRVKESKRGKGKRKTIWESSVFS